jgi:uncharacterized protein
MIIEGNEVFSQDIKDVWDALHDIDVLTRAIPGCRSMILVGNNSYVVALSLGVAAVKGDYEGKVKVTDDKPPSHYMIEGDGAGAPGFVKLRMDCWFERQDSGTLLRWRCDAEVGGLIASIGGRVLSGVSKFMAKQFFSIFRNELAARTAQIGVAAGASVRAAGAQGSAVQQKEPSRNWLSRLFWFVGRRFRATKSSKQG